jgi:uncharacterized protein YbbK (DUF523 family)
MLKEKVALSACLTGCACRYDGNNNFNSTLLAQLEAFDIIPFCPEEACFGTPRATMDLVEEGKNTSAISNETQKNLSIPILDYAEAFFKNNPEIVLFIGKDRSPSCAVRSGKVYDIEKKLLSENGTGLMAKVALDLGVESWDAETYVLSHSV